MEQQLTTITTSRAPAAIGPYSQAIRYGQLLYTSGQIPLDPATGEMVGDDITTQTRRVLHNLQAVLEQAGASLHSVIKTTVFLTHMSNFQAMNAVYADFFGDHTPARSTVAVAELPRLALVEIECVALITEEGQGE